MNIETIQKNHERFQSKLKPLQEQYFIYSTLCKHLADISIWFDSGRKEKTPEMLVLYEIKSSAQSREIMLKHLERVIDIQKQISDLQKEYFENFITEWK